MADSRVHLATLPLVPRMAALGAAALVVFAFSVAPAFADAKNPPPAQATAALEFSANDVTTVERRDIRQLISLTGTLSPRNQTTVKAKVSAEVREMLVREGESVRRGQVIARLDATEAQARLDEKIADLEGGRAQLALAEKNRAMQLALLEKKFISQNAFDSTQSNLQVSEARLKALAAQVAIARKAVEDTAVRAPMAGIVAQRLAQPGEKVAIDGKLYMLVDLSELEVEAAVPASDIGAVRIAQDVAFRVEGIEDRLFAGRIARISPATQPGTRSILVYAVLPNRESTLKGGMFAKGQLTVSKRAGALVVPTTAVRDDAGQTYVWRIDAGKLVRTVVQVGLKSENDGVIEIVSGLALGAKVVRANLGSLRDGAEAKILERR
jgi:membrane fusion protein, multidrug efflux system